MTYMKCNLLRFVRKTIDEWKIVSGFQIDDLRVHPECIMRHPKVLQRNLNLKNLSVFMFDANIKVSYGHTCVEVNEGKCEVHQTG